MSIRQIGSLLFLSAILLTTYHLCKRDPEELVVASSTSSQSQQSDHSLRSRDRLPSANHKLLQYTDPVGEHYNEQEAVLNDGYSKHERDVNVEVMNDELTNDVQNHAIEHGTDQQSFGDARVLTNETIADVRDSSSETRHLMQTYDTVQVQKSSQLHELSQSAVVSFQNSDLHSLDNAEDPNTPINPHALIERENVARPIHDHCDVSGIKTWGKGVITELKPRIRADCELMRRDNRAEIKRVKKEISSWQNSESEEEWRESLSDCEKVVSDFSNNFYNSPEEQEFPIAYILVIYTNPQQMVRLIKALWRPQNLFCIHPDAKQSEEFIGVFRQLSKCLDNIFLPTKLEKVYYQHHTIMDSQLNCYEDLLMYPPDRWKYVINLCGRELPLKTNREIVRSLKKLNGGSAIESKHLQSKGALARDRFYWKAAENYTSGKLHYTHKRLDPPPIPVYKSFNFIAVSRPFVNFFVNDKKAIDFRNYLKDVKIPEEEFYASLIHLPGVPGGLPPHRIPIPTIDKYIWMNKYTRTRSRQESCEGKMVHFICIVGVGDLDQIYRWGVNRKPPVFFFNKYFMEYDHVVMDCIEEQLLHQNMKEHETDCKHSNLQTL